MILLGDAADLKLENKSVDLVFGSPPYMDARTYGINAQRDCQEWIDWMMICTREAVRVSRGLVLWVVAGVTRDWCYWPGAEGLLYSWWKAGGRCWRPAYWHRVGIPGSGGAQWLRADIEYVLAFTDCEAKIPWADNTANGHPPKWAPGGEMSHRVSSGSRVNQWGYPIDSGATNGTLDDVTCKGKRPSHHQVRWGEIMMAKGGNRRRRGDGKREKMGRKTKEEKLALGAKPHTKSDQGEQSNGEAMREQAYLPPTLANPGNLIQGIPVGGGLLGSDLAHENEAPFPEKLAAWFIRSHCPPDGTVLDPFSGSGTTVKAAIQLGRKGIGIDIRDSQVELGKKRIAQVQQEMFV